MRRKLRLVSLMKEAFVVYLDSIVSYAEISEVSSVINVVNGGSFKVSIPIKELDELIQKEENAPLH